MEYGEWKRVRRNREERKMEKGQTRIDERSVFHTPFSLFQNTMRFTTRKIFLFLIPFSIFLIPFSI